jgi:hypothetical protein
MGQESERIAWVFRLCLSRLPSADELSRLSEVHGSHRRWYEAHSEQAELMTGDLQIEGVGAAEAAAFVATANVMMNLDEFITRE